MSPLVISAFEIVRGKSCAIRQYVGGIVGHLMFKIVNDSADLMWNKARDPQVRNKAEISRSGPS